MGSTKERRAAERVALVGHIEFIVDADVVEASAVDMSSSGIGFDVAEALPVIFRMTCEGVPMVRHARLVRVTRHEAGGFRVGLAFDEAVEAG